MRKKEWWPFLENVPGGMGVCSEHEAWNVYGIASFRRKMTKGTCGGGGPDTAKGEGEGSSGA